MAMTEFLVTRAVTSQEHDGVLILFVVAREKYAGEFILPIAVWLLRFQGQGILRHHLRTRRSRHCAHHRPHHLGLRQHRLGRQTRQAPPI